jgi:hypothetical protein
MTIDMWGKANTGLILGQLEAERQAVLSSHLIDIRRRELQLSARNLSEMDLCASVRRDMNIPPGFAVIFGQIRLNNGRPIGHNFFRHSSGLYVDITPGQFVKEFERGLKPGDRIKELQKRAPHLINIYDGGLAILRSDYSTIFNTLGWSYELGRLL